MLSALLTSAVAPTGIHDQQREICGQTAAVAGPADVSCVEVARSALPAPLDLAATRTEHARSVYVSHLSSSVTAESLLAHFARYAPSQHRPTAFRFDRSRQMAFLQYASEQAAADVAKAMAPHNVLFKPFQISCSSSSSSTSSSSSSSSSNSSSNNNNNKNNDNNSNNNSHGRGNGVTLRDGVSKVYYTKRGVRVGTQEYPFPQGRHLLSLLRLCHSKHSRSLQPLLDLLLAPRPRQAKELTETMAVVAALRRLPPPALQPTQQQQQRPEKQKQQQQQRQRRRQEKEEEKAEEKEEVEEQQQQQLDEEKVEQQEEEHVAAGQQAGKPSGLWACSAAVYVVGDGHRPFTAAALCTSTPSSWHIYSIDPLLVAPPARSLGAQWSARLSCHSCTIQDFSRNGRADDPPNKDLRLVVAVHSHAPLQAFYDSLPAPKYCITLPCCGRDSELQQSPVLSFDDPEILSPRRTIHIYQSN